MREKNSRNIIFWFFLAFFLCSIFLLARLLLPFLSILVFAAVVAGLFNPVFQFVKEKINSTTGYLLASLPILSIVMDGYHSAVVYLFVKRWFALCVFFVNPYQEIK